MSVTIRDIMELPSMREAKVLAGHKFVEKEISSITVFDSSDKEKVEENGNNNMKSYDTELVITSFANCSDDVQQQCQIIQTLKSNGETGIIIFYVGYIVPYIDDALIELANKLDLVMIVMPENRRELRYSDVIHEVMELIINDKRKAKFFAGDMIGRISRLSQNKQNINSVIEMLRDRIQCSIFIVDNYFNIINGAEWPVDRSLPIKEILQSGNLHRHKNQEIIAVETMSVKCHLIKNAIRSNSDENMYVIIIKESEGLTADTSNQVCEVLSTFINLWSKNYAKVEKSQLVRSVLKNEIYKTERICQILNLNIRYFDTMLVVLSENGEVYDQILKILLDVGELNVADKYDGKLIIFMKYQKEIIEHICSKVKAEICIYTGLNFHLDTSDAKKHYEMFVNYIDDARKIYKSKNNYTPSELMIAKECRDIINAGKYEMEKTLQPIKTLIEHKNRDLMHTMAVYCLECESNIAKTAEKLYIHKNTVKYRIKQIEEILHISIDRIPDVYLLYNSLALVRLIGDFKLSE